MLNCKSKEMHKKDSSSLLGAESPTVACDIPHDLRQVSGVGNDIDMTKHFQVRKVFRDTLLLE